MTQHHLMPTVALLLSAALFFGYISPTWNGSIAATKAAIAGDGSVLASAKQYVAEQSQLASERNAISPADLQAIGNLLPNSVNNVQTILDLNAIAARSGLSLTSANVAQGAGGSNIAGNAGASSGPAAGALGSGVANAVESVDLTLEASGTYAALQKFLAGLELNQRLLDVESLSVSGSNTGVYAYQMHVRLYWLR